MKREIKDVLKRGELVVVEFEDGHQAEFTPYSHGFGYQIEGLRRFRLFKGEVVVCNYNARLYRAGPQEDENRIVSLASTYTPQLVAEYWRAARSCTEKMYFAKHRKEDNGKLWYCWKVTTEGWMDLQMLEEGRSHFVGEDIRIGE